MNWDHLEGQWKQQRGKAEHHWGTMMNDKPSAILGRYEELVGKFQEKYGIAKDEARYHVDEYKIIVNHLKKANSELLRLHKALYKKKKLGRRSMKVKTPMKKK